MSRLSGISLNVITKNYVMGSYGHNIIEKYKIK